MHLSLFVFIRTKTVSPFPTRICLGHLHFDFPFLLRFCFLFCSDADASSLSKDSKLRLLCVKGVAGVSAFHRSPMSDFKFSSVFFFLSGFQRLLISRGLRP